MKKHIIFIILLSLLLMSCGKKSQPKPPEERAPAAVRSARIEPGSKNLKLIWQGPVETASGDEIMYLESFQILRREIRKDSSRSYIEIADINIPEDADPNKEYVYDDKDIELGKVYDYLIIPVNDEGIEGLPASSLRVSFLGDGSVVELLPYKDSEEEETDNKKK